MQCFVLLKSVKNMSENELTGLRLAKAIDLSKVDKNDRSYMRDLILRILTYHNPMPKLDPAFMDAGDHYNLTLKGWNQAIDDRDWYRTFLDANRETVFDRVITTKDIPDDGTGTPVKMFVVAKSTYAKQKKNK